MALYCYFVPLFRARSLLAPFLTLLFLGLTAPVGPVQAVYGAAILFLIFGVKDLTIVRRQAAYQVLAFLLVFAGSLLLFRTFAAWSAPAAFAALALTAILWLWLVVEAPERTGQPALPATISALLLFEVGVAIFFLPLSFFSQAALFFFGSALLFEMVAGPDPMTGRHIFIWSGTYAAIVFLMVFLAPWKV